MATANSFDILGDDDNDDPSQLIAAQQQKVAAKKPAPATAAAAAKLPSKPAPPAQAVRDSRSSTAPVRGGGIGGGRGGPGRGRGRGGAPGQNREFGNENVNGFAGTYGGGAGAGGEDGDTEKPAERERGYYGGPRQPYRGGRRGGYRNEEAGEDSERSPRRYERRSGTGRGNELKREGSGRGNWGTPNDDVLAQQPEDIVNPEDKTLTSEKQPDVEDLPASEANKEIKEGASNENEEKEPEDKEMTLEEYEKVREEKRKALLALKTEERKVELDKDFKSMQQLSLKKGTDEIFIKLGSEKDSKRKDADRDERAKKSVSINEFLKPAEGERYYSPRGRGQGRGRGRGDGGPFRGAFGGAGDISSGVAAPAIDDPGHFPTLGGKQ